MEEEISQIQDFNSNNMQRGKFLNRKYIFVFVAIVLFIISGLFIGIQFQSRFFKSQQKINDKNQRIDEKFSKTAYENTPMATKIPNDEEIIELYNRKIFNGPIFKDKIGRLRILDTGDDKIKKVIPGSRIISEYDVSSSKDFIVYIANRQYKTINRNDIEVTKNIPENVYIYYPLTGSEKLIFTKEFVEVDTTANLNANISDVEISNNEETISILSDKNILFYDIDSNLISENSISVNEMEYFSEFNSLRFSPDDNKVLLNLQGFEFSIPYIYDLNSDSLIELQNNNESYYDGLYYNNLGVEYRIPSDWISNEDLIIYQWEGMNQSESVHKILKGNIYNKKTSIIADATVKVDGKGNTHTWFMFLDRENKSIYERYKSTIIYKTDVLTGARSQVIDIPELLNLHSLRYTYAVDFSFLPVIYFMPIDYLSSGKKSFYIDTSSENPVVEYVN